jgi:hypothetical protein
MTNAVDQVAEDYRGRARLASGDARQAAAVLAQAISIADATVATAVKNPGTSR